MGIFHASEIKGRAITYRCSFCGKNQHQAKRLIAGPNHVYICDECVALCQEIINEESAGESATEDAPDQPAGDQTPDEHPHT